MTKRLIIGSGIGSIEESVSFKAKEDEQQLMILNENKSIDLGFVKSGRENRRERRKNARKRK